MRHGNNPTAMELAFGGCRIPKTLMAAPLVAVVVEALERRYKSRARHQRSPGWSCNLSYRTYRAMVSKGVLQQ